MSAVRGTLVTVELAVNASAITIPPMFVFPRLKYKNLLIRNDVPKCIGGGNRSICTHGIPDVYESFCKIC